MKERRIYRSLLRNKRESFCMRKFDNKKSSPRQLWRSIDVLLGCGGVPSCDNIDAQQIHDYFDAKSPEFDARSWCFATALHNIIVRCPFHRFDQVTIDTAVAAIRVLPYKSCALDPLLTPTLKFVNVFSRLWLNYSIIHWQPAASQPFARLCTSHLGWKRSIWIHRMCNPTAQSQTCRWVPMSGRQYQHVSQYWGNFICRSVSRHGSVTGGVTCPQSSELR